MNLTQRTEIFCRAVTQELTRLRQEAGLSQNQLAPPSGLDQSTINLLEAGKNAPTLSSLFRLAEALGTTPAEVLKVAQAALPPKQKVGLRFSTKYAEAESLVEMVNENSGPDTLPAKKPRSKKCRHP